jgi:hypothetical protein
MNRVATCAAAVLVFAAVAMPCNGQTQTAPAADRPAVAYSTAGVLYLATESGRVVRKIEPELPIGDFAISPDLRTVVFTVPHPGESGGLFVILDVASGAMEPMKPDPYFNDDSVADLAQFYSDPEFSPDGKRVVFATHAYGEGNELQLSGPLAFLNVETREVSILGSTVASDGLPFGYMRDPHWSPDGKQILGTMEGHSFVTDAGGEKLTEVMIPDSELIQSADSYGMYAIGWLGAGCVLYQAGEQPELDPARIFRLSTQEASSAAAMLRLPEASLRGLRGLSGRLRVRSDPAGYRVEGPGINWLTGGDREITFAHLLPQRDAGAAVPADCR